MASEDLEPYWYKGGIWYRLSKKGQKKKREREAREKQKARQRGWHGPPGGDSWGGGNGSS